MSQDEKRLFHFNRNIPEAWAGSDGSIRTDFNPLRYKGKEQMSEQTPVDWERLAKELAENIYQAGKICPAYRDGWGIHPDFKFRATDKEPWYKFRWPQPSEEPGFDETLYTTLRALHNKVNQIRIHNGQEPPRSEVTRPPAKVLICPTCGSSEIYRTDMFSIDTQGRNNNDAHCRNPECDWKGKEWEAER